MRLECAPFHDTLADTRARDFVYCDPPYVPLSRTASFAQYTAAGFGSLDHVRLRTAVIASRTAAVPSRDLQRPFDPVRVVQENLIDIGPAVSQRIVEAVGGRLTLRQGRHDIAFVISLPAAV